MIALIISPLISLTFAVGVALPALGLYFEVKYRNEKRRERRATPLATPVNECP